MKFTSLILLTFFILSSCHKQKVDKSAPGCIDHKVDDFSKTCCSSSAKVEEYTFQGKTVYVFDPGNCGADMASDVYDSDCNSLGFLGGIAGNTKINGEDFSNAKYIKTIWRN